MYHWRGNRNTFTKVKERTGRQNNLNIFQVKVIFKESVTNYKTINTADFEQTKIYTASHETIYDSALN